MITFKDITYRNIMSVGNNPVEMILDSHGKTLVTGANGAGKSTFLEALCFGLFGKPFRKITKNQLVNSVNKKQLEVIINFVDNKHRYKITRSIKPNKFEIERDGKLIDEEAATKDYQEYLEKHILRMSLGTFKQIVVLGTAGFTPFMLLGAGQRRAIIEDLLDISIFSIMMDLNKQQSKAVSLEVKDLETQVDKLMSEIKIHTAYEKNRRSKSKERVGELIEGLTEGIQKYQDCVQKVLDLTLSLDKATEEVLESVQDKISKAQTTLANLVAEMKQAKATGAFIKDHDHCNTCQQQISDLHKCSIEKSTTETLVGLKDQALKAKSKLTEHKKRQEARTKSQDKLREIKSEIKSTTLERGIFKGACERMKEEITTIKQQDEQEDKGKEIKALALNVKSIEGEKLSLASESHCRSVVAGILKDSGVKKVIIRKYIPSINKYINTYLRMLGANYNFTLDEEFNETIKSRGRDNFTYSSFSQGERCRIDIALLFAFRDLVSAKSGVMSNLLVLDEVYDSAADSEGVENINKILSGIKDNVFIISHNDKHQGFDRHLKMTKVGNFSKMSIAEKEA